METLRSLFRYFRPYLHKLVLYIILGFVIIAISMIGPYIMKILFDNVLMDAPFTGVPGLVLQGIPLLIGIGVVLILQAVIRQGLAYWRSYMIEAVSQNALNEMRGDLFRKLLAQSQPFLRKQNTGDIMTTINGDPEMVKNFFVGTIPQLFEVTVAAIFGSFMMASFSPYLLAAPYIVTPAIMLLSKKAGRAMREVHIQLRDNSANLSKVAQENINGIRIVKAFSQEETEVKKFNEVNDTYLNTQFFYLKQWWRRYVPMSITGALPFIFLNIIGLILVFKDMMSPGAFLAMSGYLGYITNFFNALPGWITQVQQSITSGQKILNFLHIGTEIASAPDAVKIESPVGNIRMEHVDLSYDKKVILDDVTVDLPKGKKLGVMGATGAGKTMLINVLMRFYDPRSGAVYFDGIDEKNLDLEQLRSCFSVVAQDVFLFSETVSKNIAFANPDASEDEIRLASKIAQADEFITKLPEGYDTIIGERGVGLSGGQKQRISIARAILKKAPVLILDDASSALDMETELALQKALRQYLEDRTVITIAHRVSSVMDCDEIIFLEHGKIVERGTHDELIALGGKYYEIYAAQYGLAQLA